MFLGVELVAACAVLLSLFLTSVCEQEKAALQA